MPLITTALGAILSLIGVDGYRRASHKHITALLPIFFGAPLALLGILGRKKELTADAMHSAAGLSLLGLLVSLQGLVFPQLFAATAQHPEEHPQRRAIQAVTATLCGVHFGLSVKSFVAARRAGEL